MIISSLEGTITLSGGAWSINTHNMWGIVKQIVLESTDTSNSFLFKITDKNALTIFPRDDESEKVIENKMNLTNLNIPLNGKYTLEISDATVVNDTIKYLVMFQEKA